MSKLVLQLAEVPACVSESIDVCLKAHGLSLSRELLVELGNNVAQGLYSIDQQLEAFCSCGWSGTADDADGHRCSLDAADCAGGVR